MQFSPFGFPSCMGTGRMLVAEFPLLTNLEAYYSLEEASGTRADASGNGNTLTDNNTVTQGTGIISNCADFEASNSEYLSRGKTIPDGAFTACGWANFEAISGTQKFFAQKSTVNGVNFEIDGTNWDGAINGGGGGSVRVVSAQTPGTWYFWMIRHDGVTLSASVNAGTPATASCNPPSGTVAANNFRIGEGAFGGAAAYFDGRMDEIGIWGEALTDAQITWLYNSGSGRSYAEIAAYTG